MMRCQRWLLLLLLLCFAVQIDAYTFLNVRIPRISIRQQTGVPQKSHGVRHHHRTLLLTRRWTSDSRSIDRSNEGGSSSDSASSLHQRKNNLFSHFLVQIVALLALYTFHLTVLAQHVAIIGGRIAVGYDSLAGAIIAAWYFAIYRRKFRRNSRNNNNQEPRPWNLPTAPSDETEDAETTTTTTTSIAISGEEGSSLHSKSNWSRWFLSQNWRWIRFRVSTAVTVLALIQAYFQTGRYSLFWEDLLLEMSAAGWPLTIPLSRSIQVLAGHLTWVAVGNTLLWALPRPPPFFATTSQSTKIHRNGGNYRWTRFSTEHWLWWTAGGYFVSSWLFNMADTANQYILPAQVLQDAAESVVSQLVQPENNDFWASAIGYIAPCVSAPVWEELLYRGFLLAGLTSSTGSWHASCFLQAVLFSAHHMSVTAALPLAVLGWTWAVLYTHSRNLWTVIAVHAMWNSRVFFGSWFGL